MQVKLEVCGQRQTLAYKDKTTGKDASFQYWNCREASPATCVTPFRISAADNPNVKTGDVVTFEIGELPLPPKATAVSLRGKVVAGK